MSGKRTKLVILRLISAALDHEPVLLIKPCECPENLGNPSNNMNTLFWTKEFLDPWLKSEDVKCL